ncbi:DUF862-domain-containing protein [Saccharata proteae CBS 121410]|uniref:DUF862-domain-containing protein n=1 Tax=Saccharata proteae CBS 121410 TaxID=1314787 RepID=A0A9P4HNE3_9PEZI|nr:DUF862-domain-containing protein [Saccharata proteae CBS 121410]
MDVQLYVYDLSKGLARQFSQMFLGIQIDAVYHTSVVFGGVEYFFGQGVQTCYPGTTHHGPPMEIIPLGKTNIELNVILEYLEDLKQTYTAESYDLFAKNCNNFSNDFAMFLVGKGIPEHITSLPQTVLNTPFGQMLRPQIDAAMREVTQAPVPVQNLPQTTRAHEASAKPGIASNGSMTAAQKGKVHKVTTPAELGKLLDSAKDTFAAILFTSATSKDPNLDSVFEAHAQDAGAQGVFIQVDFDAGSEVAANYNIQSAPTLVIFERGTKSDQVSNPDERRIQNRLRRLSWPDNASRKLDLPHFRQADPYDAFDEHVVQNEVLPRDTLPQVVSTDGDVNPAVLSIKDFIQKRSTLPPNEVPLPELSSFATYLREETSKQPIERSTRLYDLLRAATLDMRVAGFFAAEEKPPGATLTQLMAQVNNADPHVDGTNADIVLRLVSNMFKTPLTRDHLLPSDTSFATVLITLLTSSLLDAELELAPGRGLTLALGAVAGAVHVGRMERLGEVLSEDLQVQLVAAILERLGKVETEFALVVLIVSLAWLIYAAPSDGEVIDLCMAMDAKALIQSKHDLLNGESVFGSEYAQGVFIEVAHILLEDE